MKKINSWFNRIRVGAANNGVIIDGCVHKASPIRKGKTWQKGKCPKCGSPNGFVFRSHTNGKMYILFCQKCGKYSYKMAERHTSENKQPNTAPGDVVPEPSCDHFAVVDFDQKTGKIIHAECLLSRKEFPYCEKCRHDTLLQGKRCKCGAVLPEDRTQFCYECRPAGKGRASADPQVGQSAPKTFF